MYLYRAQVYSGVTYIAVIMAGHDKNHMFRIKTIGISGAVSSVKLTSGHEWRTENEVVFFSYFVYYFLEIKPRCTFTEIHFNERQLSLP